MKVALDADRYTDLCRGDSEIARLLEDAGEVFMPFVVLAELRAGFAVGSLGRDNERVLQRFLRKPGVAVLYPTDTTTRTYARLYRQLHRQGTPIPINDLWIAALVVEHNLALCSRDRYFDQLPQIEIV